MIYRSLDVLIRLFTIDQQALVTGILNSITARAGFVGICYVLDSIVGFVYY